MLLGGSRRGEKQGWRAEIEIDGSEMKGEKTREVLSVSPVSHFAPLLSYPFLAQVSDNAVRVTARARFENRWCRRQLSYVKVFSLSAQKGALQYVQNTNDVGTGLRAASPESSKVVFNKEG